MILHRLLNLSYVDGDYPVFQHSGPRRNGLSLLWYSLGIVITGLLLPVNQE